MKMNFKETAVVNIENSFIDCGKTCGFIRQETGRLIIAGSEIRRTAGERAVSFNGLSSLIENTGFYNNVSGATGIYGSAKMVMKQCSFNDCYADYGGAVYSESIGNVKIENCNFNRCKAAYLGAAVYFKYQKFGQYARGCECNGCIPPGDGIFNVYEDDFELRVR